MTSNNTAATKISETIAAVMPFIKQRLFIGESASDATTHGIDDARICGVVTMFDEKLNRSTYGRRQSSLLIRGLRRAVAAEAR